jgi:hypothetical protein
MTYKHAIAPTTVCDKKSKKSLSSLQIKLLEVVMVRQKIVHLPKKRMARSCLVSHHRKKVQVLHHRKKIDTIAKNTGLELA